MSKTNWKKGGVCLLSLAFLLTACKGGSDKPATTADTAAKTPGGSVTVAGTDTEPQEEFTNAAPTSAQISDYKDDPQVEELARQVEEKYGIDIVYGEDVRRNFGNEEEDLRATAFTSAEGIKTAIRSVDEAFSAFPKGLTSQLADEKRGTLKVYLLGAVGQGDNAPESGAYPAFTDNEDPELFLAIDISPDGFINVPTVSHEFTHVIDFRMHEMGKFDDEGWNKLNPEGFSYVENYETYATGEFANKYSYTEYHYTPRKLTQPPEDVYFVYNYGTVSALEDRATLLEPLIIYRMWGHDTIAPGMYEFPHIQAKTEYFLKAIEAAFDLAPEDVEIWKNAYEKLANKTEP